MDREKVRTKATQTRNLKKKKNFSLGEYLRNARIAAGLSQTDVAAILGYTTAQFISNWERDISQPPSRDLDIIAREYKVDQKEFMTKCYEHEVERAIRNVNSRFSKYLNKIEAA